MNRAFELICTLELIGIFLVFIVVMIIFLALRDMQKDVNTIYSRTYSVPSSLDLIDSLVRRIETKVGRSIVTEIVEAHEQGEKDAHLWTPTTEGLPPLETPVLTCDFTGYMSVISLINHYGVYRWQTVIGLRPYEEITAWQKLPEPYIEEKHTEDNCPVS